MSEQKTGRAIELWRPQVNQIYAMDALTYLRQIPDNTVHCVVTSPPYFGLRDYGIGGQIGLEDTPDAYLKRMVVLFREVRRVLREDGVCWVNMGDSYASDMKGGRRGQSKKQGRNAGSFFEVHKINHGLKPKDLMMMPHRLALALQQPYGKEPGWWVRMDNVWEKPNPMPESVTDRPTKAHEYVFLLTKSGTSQFWTHRDGKGTNRRPRPDYRWLNQVTGEETATAPEGWRASKEWKRINLWAGHDYWYDQEAVRQNATYGENRGTFLGGTQRLLEANVVSGGLIPSDNGKVREMTSSRNLRSVWTIPTEPTPFAHFATFPQALVEICVKAGCPETVCAVCGQGWVRQVEVTHTNYKIFDHPLRTGSLMSGGVGKNFPDTVRRDKGHHPACDCHAGTKPGIVLDLFMGSGTTALVARRLGRAYMGCDLNAEYVAMAQDRLRNTDPYQRKAVADGVVQLSLFEESA